MIVLFAVCSDQSDFPMSLICVCVSQTFSKCGALKMCSISKKRDKSGMSIFTLKLYTKLISHASDVCFFFF